MASFTLQAEPNRFGLENTSTLWNGSIHNARRTEPDGAWPSVFAGWCLFLLASRRPILLHNRSNFMGLQCVFFFTVSANTLDCEVSINAVHLRTASWVQSDKNRGSTVVKVLCYKSEGRWFDPRWCQWIFHWNKILPIALMPWGRLSL